MSIITIPVRPRRPDSVAGSWDQVWDWPALGVGVGHELPPEVFDRLDAGALLPAPCPGGVVTREYDSPGEAVADLRQALDISWTRPACPARGFTLALNGA